ncbi:MAG: hypothetical protein IVW54_09385 [Candidatus Binataceae bacterium]|nr:hypothetical protein [Candidatus Binataceae bacterium]
MKRTAGLLATIRNILLAAAALVTFGWLAMVGQGCGPGFGAVEVTSSSSGTPTSSGTATPGPLSGDVLIVGGINASSAAVAQAELFNPTTQTFTTTNSLNAARAFHTATILHSGAILVTGGQDGNGTTLKSAELFNEKNQLFHPIAASMTSVRALHTATLLNNGMVLITGGIDANGNPLASAELYDPATDKFTATPAPMHFPRAAHTATLLTNGQVLIAGGFANSAMTAVQNEAELYNPTTQKFTNITNLMQDSRFFDNAIFFSGGVLNGQVMLAGGQDNAGVITSTAELYNPASNSFAAAGLMTISRMQFASAILQNGLVLLCGGLTSGNTLTYTAELYNPGGAFGPTGNMTDFRRYHTATAFSSGPLAGMALITGGQDGLNGLNAASAVNTAEIYSSGFNSFSLISSMNNARFGHTATILP